MDNNIDKTFIPNTQWMAEKYDEMNSQLFNGALGECSFNVFTTGRGSEGGTLGWFKITGRNIRVDRYSRRMFKNTNWEKVYVNRENFVYMCQPRIELNGNYSGTEHGFLATLVHEMCHYYTYMNGFCPKQGHGPEFREIGAIVSNRSNGMFTIQRLATAEEMSELELNDAMKAKRAKRLENKKSNTIALVIYKESGDVRLVLTRSERLIYEIIGIEEKRKDTVKVFRSNDPHLIELLFSRGYKSLMRTYRFWNLRGNHILLSFINNDAEGEYVYKNPELSGQNLTVKRTQPQEQPQQKTQPKRIFSIKTSTGTFEYDGTVYAPLFRALRERFPKMSDEAIKKIMNNPANYKVMESKRSTKDIIKEVIDELMRNEFRGANNDSVEITPDMNLGEYSPLEIA